MYARAPGSASGAVAILSRQVERYLRGSGLTYTILAPKMFLEGWIPMLVGMPAGAGQPVTLVGEGKRRHALVSVRDVAAFAVAAVGNPAAYHRYVPLRLSAPAASPMIRRVRARTHRP